MSRLRDLVARIRALFTRDRLEGDLDEELRTHLEMLVEDYRRSGSSESEVRRQAILRLGGAEQVKETVRDARRFPLIDHLAQDTRYALRRLRREPTFAAAAILTIGLAVGLNTAVFSVTNAVLLRQLPYHDPDRIMLVGKGEPSNPRPGGLSEPEFYDWLERNRVFSGMATETSNWGCALVEGGVVEPLVSAKISSTLLPLLGVQAILGRNFLPDEEQAGRDKVAMISEGAWRRLFAADPGIVGRPIRLQDYGAADVYKVVGVTPASFRLVYDWKAWPASGRLGKGVDVLLPYVPHGLRHSAGARRTGHYSVYARLKPGVTLQQARASIAALHEQLKREYPTSSQRFVGKVVPVHEATFGNTRPAMLILSAAVALVLFMGCANVASLLLARGAAREQELSIRAALGGGRRRLFQQLLTENLIMTLAGGAVGLLLAAWGTRVFAGLVPPDLPRGDEIGIDWSVLAFTVAVSAVTGLLVGVVPAWRAARTDVIGVLKVGGSAGGDQGGRLRRALIAIQVAVVLVLLCAAGLMLNSLWRMTTIDLGFDTSHVMTMSLRLADQTCGEPARREAFNQRLLERVRSLPGVLQATSSSDLPFSAGGILIGFQLPSGTPHGNNFAELYLVDHEYLPLMRIPLRRGRLIDRSDRKGGMVAVVNEAFAEQVFPGINPLGQRVIVKDPYEIVGVVGNHREMLARGQAYNVRNTMNEATAGPTLRAMSLPAIYISSAQADFAWCSFYLIVRMRPDPRGLAGPIRKEISALDPDLPVQSIATLDEWSGASSASTSFYAAVLTIFALVAVVLAAVGIYGVLAQAVGQRVREIGVRMALGATRARIVWLIGWQIVVFVGIGLGVGVGVALGTTRVLASFLFDLTPTDSVTYAVVIAVLILVAAVAAYFPARRATRVDPMTALRWE